MSMKVVLMASAVLVSAIGLVPTALAGTSCSVGGNGRCDFTCAQGDTITVSASSNSKAGQSVSISGSCGGASASCTATAGSSCNANSPTKATASGSGTCDLNAGIGSGTGSCSAGGGSSGSGCIQTPVACVPCVLQCGGGGVPPVHPGPVGVPPTPPVPIEKCSGKSQPQMAIPPLSLLPCLVASHMLP